GSPWASCPQIRTTAVTPLPRRPKPRRLGTRFTLPLGVLNVSQVELRSGGIRSQALNHGLRFWRRLIRRVLRANTVPESRMTRMMAQMERMRMRKWWGELRLRHPAGVST
ncbi:hypothetical protein FRB97_008724, partial [Tulasnella sp. 331]